MQTDDNKQDAADGAQSTEGDVETHKEEGNETVSVSKAEYDKLNQTVGSLKRELKDLKKPKEGTVAEPKETSSKQPDDNRLLEKTYLRAAQITSEDEVELALTTSKKWGMPIDKLVDDEDFKLKLEKVRTQKSNELATSGIKGGAGKPQMKDTPEYWIAKGVPPTTTEVPNRKTRATIARAMMASAKNSKTFYND